MLAKGTICAEYYNGFGPVLCYMQFLYIPVIVFFYFPKLGYCSRVMALSFRSVESFSSIVWRVTRTFALVLSCIAFCRCFLSFHRWLARSCCTASAGTLTFSTFPPFLIWMVKWQELALLWLTMSFFQLFLLWARQLSIFSMMVYIAEVPLMTGNLL